MRDVRSNEMGIKVWCIPGGMHSTFNLSKDIHQILLAVA